MDDDTLWSIEQGFWEQGRAHYQQHLHARCLFAFPDPGGFMKGDGFVAELPDEGSWRDVSLTRRAIVRPADGVAVLAYRGQARREGQDLYTVRCTSTYVDDAGTPKLVQHQQTLASDD